MEAPFDTYVKEVDYKFILDAKMKYHLENGSEDQQIEAIEGFINQIENLLNNEDFLSMYFEEPGLGRVYAKLENFDEVIDIKFGISDIDCKKELKLDDLILDAKEFMANLDINLDGVSVSGIGGNLDPRDDTEPATIYLKGDYMKDQSDINVEVEKEPKTESFDNIDKRLISEGKLEFKNPKLQSSKEIIMNDDGIIELYENNKLLNSFPFAKLSLIRECKSIVQEGYILSEVEIKDSNGDVFDTEEEKENLEQAKEDLAIIKQTKEEIEDEVDKITENEEIEYDNINKTINGVAFEPTDFVNTEYSYNTINDLSPETMNDNLTDTQKEYITLLGYTIEDIYLGMQDLFNIVGLTTAENICTTILDYIIDIFENNQENNL